MMRLILFLGVAGLAAYAFLSPREEPDWNVDATVATALPEAKTAANPQADRKLRSWGPTLKSLGREHASQLASKQAGDSAPLRQEAAYRLGEPTGGAERAPEAGDGAAAVHGPVSWAKLIFAARVHSAASVSSPVIRFYGAGTELQVVGREYGWLELLDPVTQQRGFVFEKYVVAIDGPSRTQSALGSTAEPTPARVASPKVGTLKKSSRPTRQAPGEKPTMQASNDGEVTRLEGRRERLAKKEERRERKLFRWFGGRDARPAPLTVGSPR
jgi:hypothetical protein